VERFDRELAELLAAKLPEPLSVPHRVHCVVPKSPLRRRLTHLTRAAASKPPQPFRIASW